MIVKPHPGAILPLAITVRIAREVLAEAGFDPNVVTLFAHEAGDDIAQQLALRPEVRIIDFTGSTANGRWLEEHARQAQVYTEKAGVNQIIVDGAADIKAVARNIAFSLSLYTGQMCTAPQNIYVPRDGIDTADGHLSFDQVARGASPKACASCSPIRRARSKCWAPCRTTASLRRLEAARSLGTVVLDTQAIAHPAFPDATVRTPLIVKLSTADRATYLNEWFGPIAFVIATESTDESLAIARDAVRGHGALTLSVYSTSDDVIDARDRRRRGRGRRAVDQPDRRRVRQPVGGVLRLPRHRRQSRGQRVADRRRVRREPLPRRAASDACLQVNGERVNG